MKITKFGHCCLLVEESGVKILTDPGNYNETPSIQNLDVILITHEHQDHLHIPALQAILASNKDAVVYSHEGVGAVLEREKIPYVLMKDGEEVLVRGVSIERFGTEHACICHGLDVPINTGFYIAKRFFYPGDAFHNPGMPIEILALPVAGPWMKLEEAILYAKEVKPKALFPVHDGMLRQDHRLGPTRRIPKMMLEPLGISCIEIGEGDAMEF